MADFHNAPIRSVAAIKGAEFEGLDIRPFRPCVDAVASGNPLVFITGPAGTGKSTLARYLQHHFAHVVAQGERRNIAIVAPTAIAAMTAGGVTIHSFFGFGREAPHSFIPDLKAKDRLRPICKTLDMLIVDEISMVRADLFEAMEAALRLNAGSERPFGGVQIVMVGDLMQLPPVVPYNVRMLFPPAPDAPYSSKFFFGAPCMGGRELEVVHLDRIFRQTDREFIGLLHDVRMSRNLAGALRRLNEMCHRSGADKRGLEIVPTNDRADIINHRELKKIPGRPVEYPALVRGEFSSRDQMPAPDPLTVKAGARVMMVKNDMARRWINGHLGEVVGLDAELIRVRLDSGQEVEVEQDSWINYRYAYDKRSQRLVPEEIGTYTQFPMTLGWAATIHKTQGATLSELLVDMGAGAFDFGQTYVALSRCRSMRGLHLRRPLKEKDVKSDPAVRKWYAALSGDVAVIDSTSAPAEKRGEAGKHSRSGPGGAAERILTKSRVLDGVQCQKRLWLQTNQSDRARRLSLGEERIIRQGREVDQMARKLYSGGRQVVARNNDAALKETRALMAGGAKCLFQAAFSASDALVRCDILRRNGDAWDIVEVKSSTRRKDEHIDDLAVQWHVAESAGVPLAEAFLLLVNSGGKCVFPDLSNLMYEAEVTDEVQEIASRIPDLLRELGTTLDAPDAPDIPIGRRCFSPRECPFTEHCWKAVPDASFHTIPRLGWDKKEDLIARGVLRAADADVPLTKNQQRYVNAVRSGQPDVDAAAVRAQLAELEFPLHFLDFETINPAIPRFAGMRPYQSFPFQFSCHILRGTDGKEEHREFLHLDSADPRRPLLSALLECVGEAGSIVVHHKQMEAGVLEGLFDIAEVGEAERLSGMLGRLWDLEAVFKKNCLHPEFLGRTSMKAILPVIAPAMSYGNLKIQEGNDAMAAWDLTIRGEENYADALREYCKRDTGGMVEIYRHLARL